MTFITFRISTNLNVFEQYFLIESNILYYQRRPNIVIHKILFDCLFIYSVCIINILFIMDYNNTKFKFLPNYYVCTRHHQR